MTHVRQCFPIPQAISFTAFDEFKRLFATTVLGPDESRRPGESSGGGFKRWPQMDGL